MPSATYHMDFAPPASYHLGHVPSPAPYTTWPLILHVNPSSHHCTGPNLPHKPPPPPPTAPHKSQCWDMPHHTGPLQQLMTWSCHMVPLSPTPLHCMHQHPLPCTSRDPMLGPWGLQSFPAMSSFSSMGCTAPALPQGWGQATEAGGERERKKSVGRGKKAKREVASGLGCHFQLLTPRA